MWDWAGLELDRRGVAVQLDEGVWLGVQFYFCAGLTVDFVQVTLLRGTFLLCGWSVQAVHLAVPVQEV